MDSLRSGSGILRGWVGLDWEWMRSEFQGDVLLLRITVVLLLKDLEVSARLNLSPWIAFFGLY